MSDQIESAEAFALRVEKEATDDELRLDERDLIRMIKLRDASVREPLETQLDELRRRLHEQADVIAERDRRIVELRADLVELAGAASVESEHAMKAEQRIASLEAQLASAREEALRELIDRLRAEAGLHSAYDCTVLSMAIEGLLELLPAAQKEHTAQSAMASAVESKLALYTTTEPEKEPHGR